MNKVFQSKSSELQILIDQFIDTIEKTALVFHEGIINYLERKGESFGNYLNTLILLEEKADSLRHESKYKLYSYMLIPESRGDVLGIIETLDDVVDVCKKCLVQLSIEKPEIPEEFKDNYLDICKFTTKTMTELMKATRAFFTELKLVENYINKVHFYEHEVDKLEERLQRKIFSSNCSFDLAKKMQLRYFVEKLSAPSDMAESVAERLSVYAIKRRM